MERETEKTFLCFAASVPQRPDMPSAERHRRLFFRALRYPLLCALRRRLRLRFHASPQVSPRDAESDDARILGA